MNPQLLAAVQSLTSAANALLAATTNAGNTPSNPGAPPNAFPSAGGGGGLQDAVNNLGAAFTKVGQIAGTAVNAVNQFTAAVQSQIATYVAGYDPGAARRFQLATEDLRATIGEALLPVLEKFTVITRAIADVIAAASPKTKALVAGLAAAGVGMVVAAAGAAALSAAISTATGGLSLVVGAAVGLGVALAMSGSSLGGLSAVVQDLSKVALNVMDTLGAAFGTLVESAKPLMATMVDAAKSFAGVLPGVVSQFANAIGGVIAGLMPVLQTLLPPVLAVVGGLMKFNATVATLIGVALKPLFLVLQLVAAAAAPMVAGVGLIFDAFAVLGDLFNAVLGPALDFVLTPLRLVGEFARAVAAELTGALGDLGAAFGDLGQTFREVAGWVRGAMAVLAESVRPALDGIKSFVMQVVDVFTGAIRTVAGWIRSFAETLRIFFGIKRDPLTDPKGSSEGKAVRNVTISSIDAFQKEALTKAAGTSRGPADVTAEKTAGIETNTSEANVILEKIVVAINSLVDVLGRAKKLKDDVADGASTAFRYTPAGQARELMRDIFG